MALDALYSATFTQSPPIIIWEWNRMNLRVQIGEKLGVASLQILYKLKNVQQENSMLKRQSELFRAGIII